MNELICNHAVIYIKLRVDGSIEREKVVNISQGHQATMLITDHRDICDADLT
jgi:hypothetical protein